MLTSSKEIRELNNYLTFLKILKISKWLFLLFPKKTLSLTSSSIFFFFLSSIHHNDSVNIDLVGNELTHM